ncbi:MAG: DUF4845 domain-containing protein [Legionella sp.]
MQRQHGMTFIGSIVTIAVVVMAALLIMRVIPVYLQYYAIVESIKGLNTTPSSSLTGDPFQDVAILKSSLDKRLDINEVPSLKEDQLTIVPNGTNKFKVTLKYQVIKPLVYNISLLFDFNRTEEVVTGSEN